MIVNAQTTEVTGDGEDFFQELGNDPSLRASTFGYQSYDQRHVLKINATTTERSMEEMTVTEN